MNMGRVVLGGLKCIQPRSLCQSIVPPKMKLLFGGCKGKNFHVFQISAELIEAGGVVLHSEIHKFVKLVWSKELPHQWKVCL
jgi:hypothetical protein